MSGRILYLNCAAGASGDMIAGALIHLGADIRAIREGVESLGLGVAVGAVPVKKEHVAAVSFRVDIPEGTRRLRTVAEVEEVLAGSALPAGLAGRVRAVFGKLAEAEGEVHDEPLPRVHFHEMGSVDTIVDVVSAVTGLASLGVDEVLVSPVNVGSGMVTISHGTFPIPAPATARLLRGFNIFSDGEQGEKTTPTGAALIAAFARPSEGMPLMTVLGTGYGAGQTDYKKTVNVLQAVLGEARGEGAGERSEVLECTIDDMNPQVYPYLVSRLLAAGAQDAYLTPVVMKKGRPGILVTVTAPPERADALAGLLLAESTTIGLRRHAVGRTKAHRRLATLETPFGPVAVKIAEFGGRRRANPEFEDCRRAAEATGRPLVEIMRLLGELASQTFETNGDE